MGPSLDNPGLPRILELWDDPGIPGILGILGLRLPIGLRPPAMRPSWDDPGIPGILGIFGTQASHRTQASRHVTILG